MQTHTDAKLNAEAAAAGGTLAWIADEVGAALSSSATALLDMLIQAPSHELIADDAPHSPHQAQLYFRQARNAIGVMPIAGLDLLFDALGDVLGRLKTGRLRIDRELALGISDAYQAIAGYLADLRAGAAPPALRLYPYLCRVCELAGEPAPAPISLFFPDMPALALLPGATVAGAPPLEPAQWRPLFEKALLAYLTGATAAPQAAAMRDVLAAIAHAQSDPPARGRWIALHAFADLAANAHDGAALPFKRVFGLINLQIRALLTGAAVADDVLREALFVIAGAADLPPPARAVFDACRLAGLLPPDINARHYDVAIDYAPTSVADAMEAGHANADTDTRPATADSLEWDSAPDAGSDAFDGDAIALDESPADDGSAMEKLAASLTATLDTLLADSEHQLDPGTFVAGGAGRPSDTALADDFDPHLLPVLLEHGGPLLAQIGQHLKAWRQNPADLAIGMALLELMRTLQDIARDAGAVRFALALYDIELQVEPYFEAHADPAGAPSQLFDGLLADYAEAMRLFEQLPPA